MIGFFFHFLVYIFEFAFVSSQQKNLGSILTPSKRFVRSLIRIRKKDLGVGLKGRDVSGSDLIPLQYAFNHLANV